MTAPDIVGLTDFSVSEMRLKFRRDSAVPTKGWNEHAIEEHEQRLQEVKDRIEAYEESVSERRRLADNEPPSLTRHLRRRGHDIALHVYGVKVPQVIDRMVELVSRQPPTRQGIPYGSWDHSDQLRLAVRVRKPNAVRVWGTLQEHLHAGR